MKRSTSRALRLRAGITKVVRGHNFSRALNLSGAQLFPLSHPDCIAAICGDSLMSMEHDKGLKQGGSCDPKPLKFPGSLCATEMSSNSTACKMRSWVNSPDQHFLSLMGQKAHVGLSPDHL